MLWRSPVGRSTTRHGATAARPRRSGPLRGDRDAGPGTFRRVWNATGVNSVCVNQIVPVSLRSDVRPRMLDEGHLAPERKMRLATRTAPPKEGSARNRLRTRAGIQPVLARTRSVMPRVRAK
jgi:hypothetical protein